MEEPCVFIIEVHAELAGPERLIDSNGARFYAFSEFSNLVFEARRSWLLILSRSVSFVGTLLLQHGRKQTKLFSHNGLTNNIALIFRLRLSSTVALISRVLIYLSHPRFIPSFISVFRGSL